MSWQPPAWPSAAIDKIRKHPGRFLGGFVTLLLIAGLSYWWATRPVIVPPGALAVAVDAPSITDYTKTPAQVFPLTVKFSGSAAPIKAVGATAKGIRLEPDQAGTWTWSDDHTLVFTPAADWPVGKKFHLSIDVGSAIAPGVPLAANEFDFQTAPFTASVASS